MEMRHLRYFIAVAESLHFGRAAATLGIAQPSLSHQIRQLEDELETPLLRRTKRRVELTDAGRLFLEEAHEILARADRAAMVAKRAGHGDGGTLRVGVGYCMDQRLVSAAVRQFNGRHHTTRVELQTMSVPAQFEALREQRLDAGFVRPAVADGSLTSEVLVREPLIAVVPAKHSAARKRAVSLTSLAQESFILPPRERVPVFHDLVLRACREAGFIPNAPHEADHLQLVLAMVGAGAGVALVPAFARNDKEPGVAFVPLRPAPPDLEIAIARRRDNDSPVLAAFVDVARQVIKRSSEQSG